MRRRGPELTIISTCTTSPVRAAAVPKGNNAMRVMAASTLVAVPVFVLCPIGQSRTSSGLGGGAVKG